METEGLYRENGKDNGNYYMVYRGYIGIMEKNMKTTTILIGVIEAYPIKS